LQKKRISLTKTKVNVNLNINMNMNEHMNLNILEAHDGPWMVRLATREVIQHLLARRTPPFAASPSENRETMIEPERMHTRSQARVSTDKHINQCDVGASAQQIKRKRPCEGSKKAPSSPVRTGWETMAARTTNFMTQSARASGFASQSQLANTGLADPTVGTIKLEWNSECNKKHNQ
jgi:hypothetical protein